MFGPDLPARLARLDAEHDNLRTALAWEGADAGDRHARLPWALWYFWFLRGHWTEARRWMTAIFGEREHVPRSILPYVLAEASLFAGQQGEHDAALQFARDGLAAERDTHDPRARAWLMQFHGFALFSVGNVRDGLATFEEAVRLAEAAQETRVVAVSRDDSFQLGDEVISNTGRRATADRKQEWAGQNGTASIRGPGREKGHEMAQDAGVATPAVFGGFRVRMDPWQVQYGSDVAADSAESETRETVLEDIDVERSRWEPVHLTATTLPPALVFVDGVRRLEARIQIPHPQHGVVYGAFGSYAVGGVQVRDGAASFCHVEVGRVVATGAGVALPHVVPVMPAAEYRPIHAPETDPETPLRRVQQEMRQAEENLARALAAEGTALVVADGPLTFESGGRGHAVGYIKRISEWYISGPQFLATLPAGTRTPLFGIHARQRFARYAWFVRLAPPRVGDSPLSGIVRLEVSSTDVDLAGARELADQTTAVLPRFAPSPARDPRAPQNLAPIGALETRLRRAMGDPNLLRRHIETVVRKEASRG